MKAIAYQIENINELVQAQQLGMPNPKPELIEREIYFRLDFIAYAFLVYQDNETRIRIFISGQYMLLKYEADLWNQIHAFLKDK